MSSVIQDTYKIEEDFLRDFAAWDVSKSYSFHNGQTRSSAELEDIEAEMWIIIDYNYEHVENWFEHLEFKAFEYNLNKENVNHILQRVNHKVFGMKPVWDLYSIDQNAIDNIQIFLELECYFIKRMFPLAIVESSLRKLFELTPNETHNPSLTVSIYRKTLRKLFVASCAFQIPCSLQPYTLNCILFACLPSALQDIIYIAFRRQCRRDTSQENEVPTVRYISYWINSFCNNNEIYSENLNEVTLEESTFSSNDDNDLTNTISHRNRYSNSNQVQTRSQTNVQRNTRLIRIGDPRRIRSLQTTRYARTNQNRNNPITQTTHRQPRNTTHEEPEELYIELNTSLEDFLL